MWGVACKNQGKLRLLVQKNWDMNKKEVESMITWAKKLLFLRVGSWGSNPSQTIFCYFCTICVFIIILVRRPIEILHIFCSFKKFRNIFTKRLRYTIQWKSSDDLHFAAFYNVFLYELNHLLFSQPKFLQPKKSTNKCQPFGCGLNIWTCFAQTFGERERQCERKRFCFFFYFY